MHAAVRQMGRVDFSGHTNARKSGHKQRQKHCAHTPRARQAHSATTGTGHLAHSSTDARRRGCMAVATAASTPQARLRHARVGPDPERGGGLWQGQSHGGRCGLCGTTRASTRTRNAIAPDAFLLDALGQQPRARGAGVQRAHEPCGVRRGVLEHRVPERRARGWVGDGAQGWHARLRASRHKHGWWRWGRGGARTGILPRIVQATHGRISGPHDEGPPNPHRGTRHGEQRWARKQVGAAPPPRALTSASPHTGSGKTCRRTARCTSPRR